MILTRNYHMRLTEHNAYDNKKRYLHKVRRKRQRKCEERIRRGRKEDKVESFWVLAVSVRIFLGILPRMIVAPLL